MRLGEKSDLYIKAKYAFGDEGRPPKIPGGAPVIFTVELLQVGERKSRAYTRSQLKDDTLMAEAATKKTDGNNHFKEKEFRSAVDQYLEGIEIVSFMKALTGNNTTIKMAFGTEGGLFTRDIGIPTVICGPGSMDQGHKPDEFVSAEQLAQCDIMLSALNQRLVNGIQL